MLVLARKVNQRILLGDDIEITVVEVRGNRVRLGIKAPAGVTVHRVELLEQVHSENVQAAGSAQAAAETLGDLRISLIPEEESPWPALTRPEAKQQMERE